MDVGAGRPGEGGQLEHPGGQDWRGGEQEREPGGVLVVQAAPQSPAMVTPDRLIPASSAAICKTPT